MFQERTLQRVEKKVSAGNKHVGGDYLPALSGQGDVESGALDAQPAGVQKTIGRQCRFPVDGLLCGQPAGANGLCDHHQWASSIEIEIYKLVAAHYVQDLRESWLRSSFFVVVQAGLLSVFAATADKSSQPQATIGGMVVLAGFVLAVTWWIVVRGNLFWVQRWRDQVIKIDEAVDPFRYYVAVESFVWRSRAPSPNLLTRHVPLVFIGAWIAAGAILLLYK